MRSRTAPAPSSRNVLCGSATQSGVDTPAERTTDFAAGLSQASRQAAAGGAPVRHAGEVEDRAQRPVLARGAVQSDEDGVRRRGGEARQQLGVGVPKLGL